MWPQVSNKAAWDIETGLAGPVVPDEKTNATGYIVPSPMSVGLQLHLLYGCKSIYYKELHK